jgi:5,10-methylene-tetrahydrofolate dehydrogenase/methenyl tetrahydrofolate cyclohydrolase
VPLYVIVIGGGKVGFYLSKHLLERNYEVTLIEKNAKRAEEITAQLGDMVLVGDGDEVSFLATTGMERADVVVAVTTRTTSSPASSPSGNSKSAARWRASTIRPTCISSRPSASTSP